MCSSVASGCRSRVVTSVRAPETRTLLRMRLREAVPSPLRTRTRWPRAQQIWFFHNTVQSTPTMRRYEIQLADTPRTKRPRDTLGAAQTAEERSPKPMSSPVTTAKKVRARSSVFPCHGLRSQRRPADLPDEAGVIGDDGWLRPRVCAGPDMAF
jgi:hypothetical protein